MANIAITKYCNLRCPYCFAETMLEERETKNISIKRFKEILDWIKPIEEERIGIIGGEPTLHPQFSQILFILNHFCSLYNKESIIFTNGIYLNKYINQISDKTSVLININSPNFMSKDQFNDLNNTLNTLFKKEKLQGFNPQYHIGCNICSDIKDYSFLWNIVDKYEIKNIRVSVCAPTKQKDQKDKEFYYNNIKPIFLNFVKEAKKRNIGLGADCNQIPRCFYDDFELRLVDLILNEQNSLCEPVIDINADFKACSCFGSYEHLIDCREFNNIKELKNYFLGKVNYPKMLANNSNNKCKKCKQHQLLQCQGGCLSFSQKIII